MKYEDYLQSDSWKDISNKRKNIDGNKCFCCGSSERLQVHHVRYPQNWFDTETDDLRTLCKDCHLVVHKLQEYYDRYSKIFEQYRTDSGALSLSKNPELRFKLKTQTARYLAVECWRKNIFSQTDVKQFANAVMQVVNNCEWCNNLPPLEHVMEFIAIAKDCLIANNKPEFDRSRRKCSKQRK